MIGTFVNVGTILTGCTIGCAFKKGIGEKYQSTMMDCMGLVAVVLGTNAAVQALPDSKYHVLFIISLAIGSLIGAWIDIDARFNNLVNRFSGGSDLARGLSTAIMLYCIGTMSILGPIESALNGNHTYLFTNAMLDGITSIVLSSTFGFGIAFAAVAIFCWQGSIYMLATFIEPYITDTLMTEVSIIGGILILASGLSILKIKEFKTMNMLPSIFVPPVIIAILNALGF